MGKLNCWNWKNCGRYPGGPKAQEFGVCPAAEYDQADGFLGGREAGRACMYVSGTYCGGVVQGDVESKKKNCSKCDFYNVLKKVYGNEVSIYKFNDYARSNAYKRKTPLTQKWVARYKSGAETAKAAKANYS